MGGNKGRGETKEKGKGRKGKKTNETGEERRGEERKEKERKGVKLMTKAATAVWITALLKRLCGSFHEWTRNMGIAWFLLIIHTS